MKKNKQKIVIRILVSILVTSLAAVTSIWLFSRKQPKDNMPIIDSGFRVVEDQPNQDSQNDNEIDQKQQPADFEREDGKEPINRYEGKIDRTDLTGVITANEVVDNQLILRVTIDQQLSSGVCNLTLTSLSNNKIVTKKANVIANPSSSSCAGFDVPVSELSSGDWQVEIKISSSDKMKILKTQIKI